MNKDIKLKMSVLDENGKLVEIPQFIQKHINQIEKSWFEKMKKLDKTYKKQIQDLEHRLANCIEPKFKVGQEVFYLVDKYSPVLSGEVLEIQIWDLKKDNIVYVIEYSGNVHCESIVFATEAEAKAKLEELKK